MSDPGGFTVVDKGGGEVEVLYHLTEAQIQQGNYYDQQKYAAGHPVHLMTAKPAIDQLLLHPLCFADTSIRGFLEPRHDKIKSIILEGFEFSEIESEDDIWGMLPAFPTGFYKSSEHGVGLHLPNRLIIKVIEMLGDATSLVISKTRTSQFSKDSDEFVLSYREFEEARKAIGRIAEQARKASLDVRTATAFNMLAPIAGKKQMELKFRRNATTARFQKLLLDPDGLDEDDHASLIQMMSTNAQQIAKTQPAQLERLRDDVEIATLDALITEYEAKLSQNLTEDEWQAFFTLHPFILSFVFGFPIVFVEEQASIGGKKLGGEGEKIADYLYRHSMSGNVALFEIKTPDTELLYDKAFRRGVHAPHKKLSEAISQTLDQKHELLLNFTNKVFESREFELRSYAVYCCAIVGTMPVDEDRKKSLEYIRWNSRDVDIVTFDELLEKLKQLRAFFNEADD